MDAGELLRLAWEAEHDGRTRLRDALMTLAVTESGPSDAWVERVRTKLIADRPDHFLAHFASIALALEDSRVVEARERLRAKYPEARVRWMQLKAGAARGPYLGRVESLDAMIEDLVGPPAESENVRRDAPQTSRGPIHSLKAARPLAFAEVEKPVPSGLERQAVLRPIRRAQPGRLETVSEPPIEDFGVYYLTVLLAIAFLLATLQEPGGKPSGRG